MALSVPGLEANSFSVTDATSYATASFTPTAGAIIFVLVNSRNATVVPAAPTVTRAGGAETFTQIDSAAGWVANRTRLTLFKSSAAAASAGAITFDFSGVTQTQCSWIVVEQTGQDTTTPTLNNDNSIGSGTTGSLTFAAFGDAVNNYGIAGYAHQTVEDIVPDTGNSWAESAQVDSSEQGICIALHYRAGEDTTPTATWATSQSWGAVGCEVAAAGVAANKRRYTLTTTGVG